MKLLVLTSVPITAEHVRRALPDGVEPSDGEVLVVAPAIQAGPLRFWVSDADEAIAQAERAQADTVSSLQSAGASASGDTGESDPETAVQDALQTFPADRIIVFARTGEDGGYREDVDPEQLRERFGIPVVRVELD